ncbi:NYN domain-containing protein [Chitinophaga nivalis]|uniref:NYN domain-containing protein n=1 Tax=Chitinophaga nivalis TaxID=2991709 RepID=A0ABT3IVD2_9BACT|nr:NYN domain-containing protein [Chitinophaga nivalis]MCW3462362.1 NYN domain-containing protein [Chitinophaga nivalis]MCW3487947.1 NYN domain-containing protein [Chitinophaga nivalis]
MDNTNTDLRLAVLIDADNIPYHNIKGMLEEVAKYGNPTFKRIYGDWTKPTVVGWKGVLLDYAITPIQQYSYTSGKNATDSAMIIDAMDILYTGRVDGFCLVSSDSDFTRLATRLREAGMRVIGMGERKTPSAFRAACDKFIYLEILQVREKKTDPDKPRSTKEKAQKGISKADKELIQLLSTSINDIADEDGWAYLGELGNLILKKQPDFDARNYGFNKLLQLLKSFPDFEIDIRESGKKTGKLVYVRTK